MSYSAPEKSIVIKDEDSDCVEQQEEQENMENCVSSRLFIKPTHSNQTLDKEVVLRRIRQRKRMNSVRSALTSFLCSSPSAKADKKASSVARIKWVDDAFAAL